MNGTPTSLVRAFACALSWAVAGAAGAQAGASAAQGCTSPWPAARSIVASGMALHWRAAPEPVATGRHFSVEVALCPDAKGVMPELLRVDATMPDHRHGMNYKPALAPTGPGRYRADGLLLHMSGRWEFAFELRAPGASPDAAAVRLTQSLVLR